MLLWQLKQQEVVRKGQQQTREKQKRRNVLPRQRLLRGTANTDIELCVAHLLYLSVGN